MTNPFGAQISEHELAEKIIFAHDNLGLGFRRVAGELASEGIKISKDKAHRLYQKYKKTEDIDVEEDEELAQLKQTEKKSEKRLRRLRRKEETRRKIAAVANEEAMTSFERRKQLFLDADELLKFAEIVMPIVDPMLWCEFKDFCEEQSYGLANAVATAVGEQRDFEDQLTYDVNEKQSLDLYLKEQIEESLNAWKKEDKEESSEPIDYELDIIIEHNPKEYVLIPLVSVNEDSEYEEISI